MVIDIVKAIRSLKNIPWDNYLSNEGKELVSQKILASVWYPMEAVMNCLGALYKLAGKSNPALAREWGLINGGKLFENVYKSIYSGPTDTTNTLRRFETIAKTAFWKGVSSESKEVSLRHFIVNINDDDPRTEPIYYFIQGWIDIIIEKTGGKNGKVKIIEKHWKDASATVFDVTWE